MIIRLRPHHLLCLLTFAGRGYDAEFTANLASIAAELGRGARIGIVRGPDDICAPLLRRPGAHCRRLSVERRDEAAARDLRRVLGRAIVPGARLALDAKRIGRMRRAFAAGTVRSACRGCSWRRFCSRIAHERFCRAQL